MNLFKKSIIGVAGALLISTNAHSATYEIEAAEISQLFSATFDGLVFFKAVSDDGSFFGNVPDVSNPTFGVKGPATYRVISTLCFAAPTRFGGQTTIQTLSTCICGPCTSNRPLNLHRPKYEKRGFVTSTTSCNPLLMAKTNLAIRTSYGCLTRARTRLC